MNTAIWTNITLITCDYDPKIPCDKYGYGHGYRESAFFTGYGEGKCGGGGLLSYEDSGSGRCCGYGYRDADGFGKGNI